MPNSYFQFKKFTINQERSAMKVSTDACLFGAWTAHLLKTILPKKTSALDIGTGTGLLSFMVAQELDIEVDAVEIDEGAANDAAENFQSSSFGERIHLHHNPIQQFEGKTGGYELIISNPPFYENSLKANSSSKNVARHDDGLTLDLLLASIKRLMSSNAFIAILYPASESARLERKAKENGLLTSTKTLVRQTPNHDPFRVMYIFTANPVELFSPQELVIKNSDGDYSEEFGKLLQPFYLAL